MPCLNKLVNGDPNSRERLSVYIFAISRRPAPGFGALTAAVGGWDVAGPACPRLPALTPISGPRSPSSWRSTATLPYACGVRRRGVTGR